MKRGAFGAVSLLTAVLACSVQTIFACADEMPPAETTAAVTTSAAAAATTTVTEITTVSTTGTSLFTETSVTETTAVSETTAETAPMGAGWEEKDGKRFYRLENGEYARGEVLIEGVTYLFGYSGAQKTDWQTVDGKRRYYDPETGKAVIGWLEYFGHRYYISADDGKLENRQEISNSVYCFDEKGILMTGSFSDGVHQCFSDAKTGEIKAGLHEQDSRKILTDEDGVILFGWQTLGDGKCFADPITGWIQSGRFTDDEKSYYIDPQTCIAEEGLHECDDGICLTNENGELLTGWQDYDGKRFFIAEDTGYVQIGLFQTDGAWYLGTKEGLASGIQQLGDDRVIFDESTCVLKTGWFTLDGKRYYLDPGSRTCCKNGFFRIHEDIYYFKEDGSTGSGLTKISGRLFALDENGKRLTGLQTFDGANYYFDPESGCAVTGKAVTPGGTIRLGQDGKQMFGWYQIGEDYYYTDPVTGFVLPGLQVIEGRNFWFEDDGRYDPNHFIDGRLYDQNDPYWATVKFNEKDGSDMKTSACGIFSFCNAIYALNEKKADAVEVAQWAISVDAYRPGNGGTYRSILYDNIEQRYGEELGFTLGGQFYGMISDARLQQHLMGGNVAVIHVPNHFMAVIGYNPETMLYHVLESCESDSRGLLGDSWVTADKLSNGKTKVDWYVLIVNRS